MALIKELKGTFVGGKISRSLQNRIDLEKFNTWLAEAKNTQIKPEGSISNRAGTIYVATAKSEGYRLTINSNVTATIIINGVVYESQTSKYVTLEEGSQYTYSVGAEGYTVVSGSGTITGNKVITVELEATADTYTFSITNSQGATITINEVEQSSITASSGKLVEWKVEKTGYATQSGAFLLTEDETKIVELDAVTTFNLTINVTPTDANIKVKVDNITVFEGGSPTVAVLEAGTDYSYEISKNGYITETGGGTLNQDTTITTTLQLSSINLVNLKPAISGQKPTTQTVNFLYTYNIKKTGTYKIMLGGGKARWVYPSNDVTRNGGTAVLETLFTSGDIIKIYRIDGGYIYRAGYRFVEAPFYGGGTTKTIDLSAVYAGSGIGIKLNDEWILVAGGAGYVLQTKDNNGNLKIAGCGGGGYNGGSVGSNIGGVPASSYISRGISQDGTRGTGIGNTAGSGSTGSVRPTGSLYTYFGYGGTGYVKGTYSAQAVLTTGNNNNEGYAKIEYIG